MPNASVGLESLADLLAHLAATSGRGRLVIGAGDPVAEVWIDEGRIVDARAENADRRLGARLTSTGRLSAADLSRAERAAARDHTTLRAALQGRVPQDVITLISRDEARYAVAAALAAPPEDILFESDADVTAGPLSLDPAELLMETQGFLAALGDAQSPALAGATLRAARGAPPVEGLTPEDWAILGLSDGTRSTRELADQCGLPYPELCLLAGRLSALGLLDIEADDGGMGGSDELLAELEAASNAAAASSIGFVETEEFLGEEAFQIVEIIAPVAEEPPPAEASAPAAFIPEPAEPEAVVDTLALLRELSSLARDVEAR